MFFEIDEFCREFEPLWKEHLLTDGLKKRHRRRRLSLAEVMTILILFHQSGYRNLKQFYLELVCVHLGSEFPELVSYNRFVEFERDALLPLAAYLQTKGGNCTGISFVDSTVSPSKLIFQYRKKLANLLAQFYGFKSLFCNLVKNFA